MIATDRILTVDPSASPLLSTAFDDQKYTITAAAAGDEAMARLLEEPHQLVIFTYDLGDMTGAEFCRAVRAHEGTRATSLLFVADHGREDQIDLCLAAGCNDVVFRPLQRNEVRARILALTSIPRRQDLRTVTKVELASPDGKYFVIGHSLNISATGMLLEIEYLLPPEATIGVSFYLPGDPSSIETGAVVNRADFEGSIPRYGLHFNGLGEQSARRIDAYVRQMQEREGM
ncbi:MAG: response regulator [Acidobacteriota bacterium]